MALNQPNRTSGLFKILLQVPVPWIFVLTYLAGVFLQMTFPVPIHSREVILYSKIAGIGLFLAGGVIAAWSLVIFGKAHTTTTPGERSKRLILSGPYRMSRNPMYISLTLLYIGEAGFLAQIWPVLFLPCTLAYVSRVVIPLEEAVLRHDFGQQYEEYCSRVHRWL